MKRIPCLTETKRLPQDFLLVNVYREMTGHILYRPVKFRRGLQVWQIGKHYFLQHPVGLCSTVEASWHSTQRVTVTHSFARLVLEDGWTRNQGFTEMMVVIGTFEGISDWRPTGSLWSDLRCYLNRVPHLSRRDKQMYAYKKSISEVINIKTGSTNIFKINWCLN